MTLLTARPKSLFSPSWEVFDGDALLATLAQSAWKEKAEIHFSDGSDPFTLNREGLLSGMYRLLQGEKVIVRAEKPSVWKNSFVIDLAGREVHLKPDGPSHRTFTLYDTDDGVLGRIVREGLFKVRATLDLPADWPLPLQLFVFWLVVLIWSRDNQAAS